MARITPFKVYLPWIIGLLMAQVDITAGSLTFKITGYNSSMVEFSCQYQGKETINYINVQKGRGKCVVHTAKGCNSIDKNNCQCKESQDPNLVSFLVYIDGTCKEPKEETAIRCSVKGKPELTKTIMVSPPSDPPIISINHDKPVEAGCQPIPVTCTVPNMCSKMVELHSGDLHIRPYTTTNTEHGSRFNSTVTTTALVNEPGIYTITCKEDGQDDDFALKYNFTVNGKGGAAPNVAPLSQGGDAMLDRKVMPSLIAVIIGFLFIVILRCACMA